MKNFLFILLVAFAFLISGCRNGTSTKEADKTIVNRSYNSKVEQKADETKQKAEDLNRELDSMIRESTNGK